MSKFAKFVAVGITLGVLAFGVGMGLFLAQVKFYKPALFYAAQVETFLKNYPAVKNAWQAQLAAIVQKQLSCPNLNLSSSIKDLKKAIEEETKLVEELRKELELNLQKDLVKLSFDDELLLKTLKALNLKEKINAELLYASYRVLTAKCETEAKQPNE